MINKDTLIFGSFSSNPGNNGCVYFNNKFKDNDINAIYKSFYSEDIETSLMSAISLGFSGFAVSMPFKFEIIKYVDHMDKAVKEIGAANTILIKSNKTYAYNTDWIAAKQYIEKLGISEIMILGNGGFSKAIQYACKQLNIKYKIITRENWELINKEQELYIFNATPADVDNKNLIDGRPHTKTGKEIATMQAEKQYDIYSELFI